MTPLRRSSSSTVRCAVCLRSAKAHTLFPAAAVRPSLRATHSAAELGGGGGGGGSNYSIDQLNASAAGKDQFFARKMQENASRCVCGGEASGWVPR